MAEQKKPEETEPQMRQKAALKIMGLVDRQEATLTAVERILQEYDAAKQA